MSTYVVQKELDDILQAIHSATHPLTPDQHEKVNIVKKMLADRIKTLKEWDAELSAIEDLIEEKKYKKADSVIWKMLTSGTCGFTVELELHGLMSTISAIKFLGKSGE